MKITLYIRLEIEGKEDSIKRFKKTIESSITPIVGDKYHEDHFGTFRSIDVKEVVVNYENNEYHVLLEKRVIKEKNPKSLIDFSEKLLTNGWSLNKDV